jgi:5-methylcytosine-specific restriction endonuclease McrA
MRDVKEWFGKNDNSMPPASVKARIIERQDNKCALTGQTFRPGDVIHFDHVTPLWLAGQNREANLQAVIAEAHKRKTQTEATVRAKVMRQRNKHLGIDRKPSTFKRPAKAKFNWSKGRYEVER